LLNLLPSIDIIIIKDKIGVEDSANKMAFHLMENEINSALIVIGTNDKYNLGLNFKTISDWEKIVHSVGKILGFTEEQLNLKNNPEFVSIDPQYLKSLEATSCDIYIRIKKGPTSFQYIKRFLAIDRIDQSDYERYIKEGLKHFYIKKEDREQFTIYLSNHLISKLEGIEQVGDLAEKIEIISDSYGVAINHINEIGLTRSTIQLTDSIVSTMGKTFEYHPQISSHLQNVLISKGSKLFQYYHMISIIASESLKVLGNTNLNYLQSLTYAAFFHDLALTEFPDLTKISNSEELEFLKNEQMDQYELVNLHAKVSADLIKNQQGFGEFTAQIVREHHGSITGIGFPYPPDKSLHPLSRLFIIVEEFVRHLFRYQEAGGAPKPVIEILKEKYPEEEFKVSLSALNKLLIKNKKETN
jgi:response regulator RpfG family c-di-GMP phosphodiesterase